MMRSLDRRLIAALLLTAVSAAGIAQDDLLPLDPVTGLKMSGDWQLVRSNCIACHSPKLITQQRGSADQWLRMIRWMQDKQNLWQFEPEVEERIVAYLAENYPPPTNRRRAAIPPDLMPPNPYATN